MKLFRKLIKHRSSNTGEYWVKSYAKGGASGLGSYRKLAKFKAKVINKFV